MWWGIYYIFGLVAYVVLLNKAPLSIGENGKVIPDEKKRLENATTIDIIISIFAPVLGLMIGAFAFFIKGEKNRGSTMMTTALVVVGIILFLITISEYCMRPEFVRPASRIRATPAHTDR